jgi:hypothetical protein
MYFAIFRLNEKTCVYLLHVFTNLTCVIFICTLKTMNNIDIFVLKHLPGGGTWDPANPSLLALPSNIRLIWKCLLTNIITQFIVLMLASVFDPGKYLQPSGIFASK